MSNTFDHEVVLDMLRQIAETLERIKNSFSTVAAPDSFYASDEGREKLDAISMKLLAIGELLKNIDRKTNKLLLPQYERIDWVGFIGLRDVIAHDYYNLNPVKIFDICTNETETLALSINQIITDLQSN